MKRNSWEGWSKDDRRETLELLRKAMNVAGFIALFFLVSLLMNAAGLVREGGYWGN
jgi:hypothetical protein